MNAEEIKSIEALLRREVVPAMGCTEPVAVSLCAAKAAELLGGVPEKVIVSLSANVIKNAMGVGIPGTGGMIGLPVAVALGVLGGKSEYGLEVLKDIDQDVVDRATALVDNGIIEIRHEESIDRKLYIKADCFSGEDSASAVIADQHANFVYLSQGKEILLDRLRNEEEELSDELMLNMRKVYDFAVEAPLGQIEFILDSVTFNKAVAECSMEGNYGHGLGALLKGPAGRWMLKDGIYRKILAYTSAACDARMSGISMTVMSNSGSGNQGIVATLPVAVFAEGNGNSREELIRALTFSHLMVVYIKQSLGRLSGLCGCVVAASGSACGLVYLMGGNYEQACYAVKNMIANLTGMICDGAKPSCSLKVTSAVSMAGLSAMLAMESRCVQAVEGIIEEDVDESIKNMTLLGSVGMAETDKLILHIMTHKKAGKQS